MCVQCSKEGFLWCLEKVFEIEGFYSLDPTDSGGETKWGISKKAFPLLDIQELTKGDATEIYRKHYWDAIKGNILWVGNPPLTLLTFDGAVNHGPPQSILLLQKALGVEQDSFVGPQTLRAVEKAGVAEVARFLALRAEFYVKLIEKRPPQVKFRNGWFNRLFKMALWSSEAGKRDGP